MASTNIRDYLPLTESTYYILISLMEPLHGYGIMQNVAEVSGGRVQLGPGTLYGALNKLEKEGLIVQTKRPDQADSRRKCYVLTSRGKELVRLEFRRLVQLAQNTEAVVEQLERGGEES